jgi:hypothetical protein
MGRDYSPSKPHHDRDGVNGLPPAVAETVLSFFFGLCTERNPDRSGVPHTEESSRTRSLNRDFGRNAVMKRLQAVGVSWGGSESHRSAARGAHRRGSRGHGTGMSSG